ncbi:MAG: PorP/SprF family type IX secretion system membrane protein [Bacteroidales bacterium]|nr:PorP/SprF family type IX secretion system membrane protein [Bacteroidales bacterium]
MKKLFVGIFCFRMVTLLSQDIHISQFWVSPVSINPASAGFFDGNIRIGAYNRTQWRSITKAYQTAGASIDLPVVKRPGKQDMFGFGVMMDYDQAGDSKYTTMQGNLLFSYARAINSRNNNFLMGGISFGGGQRSWSYSQLQFDEQFQNGMFNPDIGNSETYYGNNYWFADMGMGVQWFYQPGFLDFYQVGFSVYHLNKPRISMLKDDDIRLPIKWVSHAIVSIEVHPDIAVMPVMYFAVQQKYREFLLGGIYAHSLPIDVKGFINKAKIGLFYRWNDAFYLAFGMDWRRLTFSISYDFNVSKLVKASQARGGVEIIVSCIIKKKQYIKRKAIPCSVF